jgi:hypothetical protein
MTLGCTVAEIDCPTAQSLLVVTMSVNNSSRFYGLTFSATGGLRNIPRLFDTAKVGTAASLWRS